MIAIIACVDVGVLQNAAADMERTVATMENAGVDSYILDLRNNPVSTPYPVAEHQNALICLSPVLQI